MEVSGRARSGFARQVLSSAHKFIVEVSGEARSCLPRSARLCETSPLVSTIFMDERKETSDDNQLAERLNDPNYLASRDEILGFLGSLDDSSRRDYLLGGSEEKRYEVLNQEFIASLASYLAERIGVLGKEADVPVTILEVGAGDGRLTHFLQGELDSQLPGRAQIIAIDSGEDQVKPAFSVETVGQKKALAKYKPQIVICSWMPLDKDWNRDFRTTLSVKEYILIGKPDVCGNDRTYDEREGFERFDLDEISKWQISRMEIAKGAKYFRREGHWRENFKPDSATISFRRKR